MRVLLCGVRGSTPAPGPEFVRYGGNTSCVAVAHDGDDPTLVLDAGTGLVRLSKRLGSREFRGTILLTHLHWDHTHGLPFFAAADRDGGAAKVLMPAQGDPSEVMDRVMSPPHFPVRVSELRGDWHLGGIETGEAEIEGFKVTIAELPHKGGRTYGYRISDGSSTLVYMPDHSPINLGRGDGHGAFHHDAIALARGADLLLHDAQYTADEFAARATYGHTTPDYAVELGRRAEVRTVMLFHHDPSRVDDALDGIVRGYAGVDVEVRAAAEGAELKLG